jgi:hypothetical protein
MEVPIENLIDKIRTKLIPPLSSRWKDVHLFAPTKSQGDEFFIWYIRGITLDSPPRYFLAWAYISPRDITSGKTTYSYLESKATSLVAKLDDFLNPLCRCVPSSDGSIGDPCDYHQGKHRSITIEPVEQTRFPEGAEL